MLFGYSGIWVAIRFLMFVYMSNKCFEPHSRAWFSMLCKISNKTLEMIFVFNLQFFSLYFYFRSLYLVNILFSLLTSRSFIHRFIQMNVKKKNGIFIEEMMMSKESNSDDKQKKTIQWTETFIHIVPLSLFSHFHFSNATTFSFHFLFDAFALFTLMFQIVVELNS